MNWNEHSFAYVVVAVGAAGMLLAHRPWRDRLLLLIPVSVIGLREIVFYAPIPATIATHDNVLCWSKPVLIAAAVCLALEIRVYFGFRYRMVAGGDIDVFGRETIGYPYPFLFFYLFWYFFFSPFVSRAYFPTKGPGHLLVPFIFWIAPIKFVLLNPVTIIAVAAASVLHLTFLILGCGDRARAAYKVMFVAIVAGGAVHLVYSIVSLHELRQILPTSNFPNFYSTWSGQLNDIHACGINAVEFAASYPRCEVRKLLPLLPNEWAALANRGHFWFIMGLGVASGALVVSVLLWHGLFATSKMERARRKGHRAASD